METREIVLTVKELYRAIQLVAVKYGPVFDAT